MTLANLNLWLARAQREHFALGAFNANTMEQVQAIVAAAEEERAPAIIQVSHRALLHAGSGNAILGLRYMAAVGQVAAASVTVPIALHLDHATESEVIQAIGLGFTSVMFDGADLPPEEKNRVVKKLVALAHPVGVSVEAELGEVPRANSSGYGVAQNSMTDPGDAAQFVAMTGIDVLAIAIGSVHAVKQKSVTLDLDRLEAIRAAVDIPLVLHGSSGVTDEHVAQGIARGLCKVNVATQLNQAFTRGVSATLQDGGEVDPRNYLGPARAEMKERVRERIRFFGTTGKA